MHVLKGTPPISLLVRRSPRARRISLRVSRLDGRVTLTLPRGVTDREGLAFAESRSDWIRGHLADLVAPEIVGADTVIPVEGRDRRIVTGAGAGVRLLPDTIEAPLHRPSPERRIGAFLKALARDRLALAADHYAKQLGLGYSRLTLRDTRSRWGSCSAQGALNFSWRLILAPPEVLRYVAAHEVAHLAEMNHSSRFWARVEEIHGPYAAPRDWLRVRGETLHRYRFEAAAQPTD